MRIASHSLILSLATNEHFSQPNHNPDHVAYLIEGLFLHGEQTAKLKIAVLLLLDLLQRHGFFSRSLFGISIV